MFRNIRLILGLTKLRDDEVINELYDLHDNLAQQVMRDKVINEEVIN